MGGVCGGIVLLLVLLAVTGGLKDKPKEPETVSPDRAIDQGRFSVQIISATGTGNTLTVRMKVENKGDEPASFSKVGGFAQGFGVRTKPGAFARPDEVRAEVRALQPEIPIELEADWTDKTPPPAKINLAFVKWEYEPGFADTSFRWQFDTDKPDIAAVLTVAVTPK